MILISSTNLVFIGTGIVRLLLFENSFSFSQSFLQADAIPGSAVTTGASPNFSDVTSIAGGTPSNLAGTISTAGSIALTAGGENTEAVGQVITTLIVD